MKIETRYDILNLLPPGPVTGVEVGTDTGINARELLLQRPDLFLWTVDPFEATKAFPEKGRVEAQRCYQERVGEFVRAGRTEHIKLTSVQAARRFGELTGGAVPRFIYIDANHEEEFVRQDLAVWWPLLAAGGLMAGHDFDDPGTSAAVISFAKAHRLDLQVINEHGGPEDMGRDPHRLAWTGATASHDDRTPGTGYDKWGGWVHPTWWFFKPGGDGR